MQQPPTKQPPAEPISEKRDERNAWRDEQEKHAYYYDDAHGYQAYDPGTEEDGEKATDNSPTE